MLHIMFEGVELQLHWTMSENKDNKIIKLIIFIIKTIYTL